MDEESVSARLVGYLDAWRVIPQGQNAASLRGAEAWWVQSADAVRCLLDLEDLLARPEHSELARSYESVADEIRQALFVARFGMLQGVNGTTLLDPRAVSVMRAIAAALDGADKPGALQVIALTPEFRALADFSIRMSEEISGLGLGEEASQYLLLLLGELDEALSEVGTSGLAQVRERAERLAGALLFQFVNGDAKEAKKASQLAGTLLDKVGKVINSPIVAALIGGTTPGLVELMAR